MASFGWKRKTGEKVSKSTLQHFVAETQEAAEEGSQQDEDWLQAAKKRREVLQEDCGAQSRRLQAEGAQLAEEGRWDMLLHISDVHCFCRFTLVFFF